MIRDSEPASGYGVSAVWEWALSLKQTRLNKSWCLFQTQTSQWTHLAENSVLPFEDKNKFLNFDLQSFIKEKKNHQ